jgi:hypothetical protein
MKKPTKEKTTTATHEVEYFIYQLNDDISDRLTLTPMGNLSYETEEKAIEDIMYDIDTGHGRYANGIDNVVILPVRNFNK